MAISLCALLSGLTVLLTVHCTHKDFCVVNPEIFCVFRSYNIVTPQDEMNSDLKMANDLYNKSQEPHGISRPLRRSYLEKSLSLYRSQMRHATLKNIPSLQKNFGLASYRLVDVLDAEDDLPMIFYHLGEAIQAFSTAWSMRPDEQQTEWGGRLEELISDCFEKSYRARKCYCNTQ